MRKFAVCSEHFDPAVLIAVNRKGQLPPDTIPVRVGKTHMTRQMLLVQGFTTEAVTFDETHPSDLVLVEMLDNAEEVTIKREPGAEESDLFEFVRVKRMDEEERRNNFEDEIKQEPVDETEAEPTPVAVEDKQAPEKEPSNDLNPEVPPTVKKHKPCEQCASFKPRYKYEVRKNKRLEEAIAQNKKRIVIETARLQKLDERLALKTRKRIELQNKLSELRKRWKNGVPLNEILQPAAVADSSGDDDGQTEAWW